MSHCMTEDLHLSFNVICVVAFSGRYTSHVIVGPVSGLHQLNPA